MVIACARKDTRFIFVNMHFLLGKNCNAIVVAELAKRDQRGVGDPIEDMGRRCCVRKRFMKRQLSGLRGLNSVIVR